MNNRPILIITISYIIGIILGLYLEINIALFVILALTSIFILFCYIKKNNITLRINTKNTLKLILVCFSTIIIALLIISNLEKRFNDLYSDIGKDCLFTGYIVDIGKETQYYKVYTVKIESVNNQTKYKNTKILLRIKKSKKQLNYGDKISGIGDFEKPSVRRNYKGFDYSKNLKTKGIYMICVSTSDNITILNNKSLNMYDMWIYKLKNTIKRNLKIILPSDCANISSALLLGDTTMLDVEQKQTFSDASLSHVLAISGMHVSFVILGIELNLKRFDKRKGKYLFILILIFFAQFTGGAPSVIRAVIMAVIAISSKLFFRKSDTLNNIAIAALILLISNPYNILNLGFQLSFMGTLGIVLLNNKIVTKLRVIKCTKIKELISVSISANIMILPIVVNTYNTISFIFIISNILVSPLLGIMCGLGYLTAFVSLLSIRLAKIFGFFFNIIMRLFILVANCCSNIEFLKFTVNTPNIIIYIAYYICVLYLFFYYKKRHIKKLKKIISLSAIVIIIFNVVHINNFKLRIYFIDVGQGDCTLIVTSTNKTILIDGGGSEDNNYDIGEKVLIPYLLDRGVSKIDYVIFSHFDSDHAKGLLSVMKKMKVINAIISKQGKLSDNYKVFLELTKKKKINVKYIQARRQSKN